MAEKDGADVETMAREFVKRHRPTSLLQRFATVEEVASMVCIRASPQASATNGAALRVDGGVVRRSLDDDLSRPLHNLSKSEKFSPGIELGATWENADF